MKKMSLFMGMIAFLSITTSCEQDEQVNQVVNGKSGFNAEAVYWDILTNKESGITIFEELTNNQKAAVWSFKYDRFTASNNLNTDQIAAINNLKDYMIYTYLTNEQNASLENQLSDEINSNFSEDYSLFLLHTLENDISDISSSWLMDEEFSSTEKGCWFCWESIDEPSGCHAELNTDGKPTGNYFFTVRVRYRFGPFRTGRTGTAILSCGINEWDNSFAHHPF